MAQKRKAEVIIQTSKPMKKSKKERLLKAKRKHAFVKGAIAPYGGKKELKYVDLANASYAGDTTGSVTALNLIAEGDDNTMRQGRQVVIKSVQLRGNVNPYDTATPQPVKARMLLVWDNAVNSGSLPAISAILAQAVPNSFPLIDNAQRFTILADRAFVFGPCNDAATQSYSAVPGIYDIELYKKLNLPVQYTGTSATIGAVQNGGLYLVTLGDQSATNGATFKIATRVRFVDP